MRAYFFSHAWLSPLQKGLQAAHVVHELFNKYQSDTLQKTLLNEWSNNHKTIVILNGGNSKSLREMYLTFRRLDVPYPFESFHEDEQSLNGALTCVGIVLDEQLIKAVKMVRNKIVLSQVEYSRDEITLASIVATCSLAN